jgi:hypothetical protein
MDDKDNKLIKITRIDLAVDYPYLLNPLMFTSRANKMSVFFSKKHGVETFYFGTSRSKKQVRLYNKRLEMIEQGQGWCDNEHLWRFEMSFSDSFFIDDQQDSGTIFSNPFISFVYYDFDKLHDILEFKPKDFDVYTLLNSANFGLGIQATISQFLSKIKNKSSRESFVRRLKLKLKKYEYSHGPVTHPSKVYDDQFLFEWNLLRVQIKDTFDFGAKS